jgi:hypothetical protein
MGNRRLVLVVVALVAVAGVAAGAWLLAAKRAEERALGPVAVSAPDLFPPETSAFVALHGMQQDWEEWDDLRRRVEPTATWKTVEDMMEGARRGPMGQAKGMKGAFDEALAAVEARLGKKVDTKEFFETFGRYTALGVVPGQGEAPARFLLVTRLPDEGAGDQLRDRFVKNEAIRRREPDAAHGYAVFQEPPGEGKPVLYGVGAGYLFVSNDAEVLDGALGRLNALVTGGGDAGKRPPALAADPVFRRGVPEKWEDVRFALYLRKDHGLERIDPAMAAVGEFAKRAFVLAPADAALAMATSGPAGHRTVRASWAPRAGQGLAWERRLPAGLCLAYLPRPEAEGAREKAFGPDLERLRAKRLWKEMDALARDTPRLKRILGEALGEESVPPDEILSRVHADLALVGAGADALAEALLVGEESSLAVAGKVYRGDGVSTQYAFAMEADPAVEMALAAALDLAAEKARSGEKALVVREGEPGALVWRLDTRVVEEEMVRSGAPREFRDILGGLWESLEPSVVLGGGTVYVVLGRGMLADVRAAALGKGALLESDPAFVEALGAVDPGACALYFERPGEAIQAAVDAAAEFAERALEGAHAPPEAVEVLTAALKAASEAAGWAAALRTRVTAWYLDPARPALTVTLVDGAKENEGPRIEMDPAALRVPGVLPGSTFLLCEGRWDLGPASRAAVASFLKHLPGGKDKWRTLFEKEGESPEILEGPLDALVANLRGEAGMALVAPAVRPAPEGPPSMQELFDRAPSLVLFAQYADAGKAHAAWTKLMGLVRDAFEEGEEPFEKRASDFAEMTGPQPWGLSLESTGSGESVTSVLRLRTVEGPGAPPSSYEAAAIRRGDMVFLVFGGPVARAVAAAAEGGPDSLAARLKEKAPAGLLPDQPAAAFWFRADGFAECLAAYLEMAVPMGPQFTLQAYAMKGEEPPADRLQAHREGWRKGVDLVVDALRTGTVHGFGTVRKGDRWVTEHRRGQER